MHSAIKTLYVHSEQNKYPIFRFPHEPWNKNNRFYIFFQECQTSPGQLANGGGPPSINASPSAAFSSAAASVSLNVSSGNSSIDSSNNSPSYLERSQSLRISKKSLRSMAKGGSLRLSKKDALIFKEEEEDGEEDEDPDFKPKKGQSGKEECKQQ